MARTKLPSSMSGLSSQTESIGTKISIKPKTLIIITIIFVLLVILLKIFNPFHF